MKKLFFLIVMGMFISCSVFRNPTPVLKEGNLFTVRKYVGVFVDYRYTGTESFAGTSLIWVKTSMDSTFGKMSAYGKKCDFRPGQRLYIRRIYYSPGEVSSYWEYNIENDSTVYYRLTDFQNDHKVYVQSWFY